MRYFGEKGGDVQMCGYADMRMCRCADVRICRCFSSRIRPACGHVQDNEYVRPTRRLLSMRPQAVACGSGGRIIRY